MYDTIIVGAGSAGCVLASRLSADPDRRVLLLEAGGEPPINSRIPSDWVTLFNTAADWGYYTVAQPGCRGRRIFWPRGKMVGGSGAMNAMIYIRGLPSDFDTWESLGCPGWGWKDVLPDFIATEGNTGQTDPAYHGTSGPLHVEDVAWTHPWERAWIEAGVAAGYPANPDFNGPEQEGFGFFQFTIREGARSGTSRAFLEGALARPNLTLKTGVLITKVIIENGRAKGVEYLENGVPKKVYAEAEVVLSAGSIGSCQTLMLSGVGPADELSAVGVTPVLDVPQVGKNLQDHINIPFSYYAKEEGGIGAWDEAFLTASQEEWERAKTGPRTSAWVAAGAHVRSRPDVEPDLQFYGAASPHRDYARFLASKSGMTMHCTLQRPESRGEIRLRSANPLDHPDLDPKYFISDPSGRDIATLVEAIRIQRRVAATEPLASLLGEEMQPSAECRSDAELETYIRGHCTTLYHPAGTLRMGTDAAAPVDPSSFAVKGIEGLHVADASLFPRMISGNTNTATVLIAERAARAIAGRVPAAAEAGA
ncbi:GMC family oxidoreductase [Oceanicella sp. SM1341]|uniref:GMC family oxidoreductase n=1 Tax=Oceanicella sp. SM1341 TaxID=1548889 RepID=UPI000E512FCF|nr:GMC family oxidoreductase N-terminal domain-containing protein [Oceanicella sp. SM1341]